MICRLHTLKTRARLALLGLLLLVLQTAAGAQEKRDTVVVHDTTVIIHYYPAGKIPAQYRQPKQRMSVSQEPSWAVKTNLPLWGILAPNVEAEMPLGKNNRWSLDAEFFCPWWVLGQNAYALQAVNLGAEIRYWLGKRTYFRCLEGWHLGLALAGGRYDIEWDSEGWQGYHINTYFNAGYQFRLGRSKRWGLDLGLGLGVLYSPVALHYLGSRLYPENHPEETNDHLMFQDQTCFFWPGPCHVNISLLYFFDFKR